ncbi:MAG: hypothetical protein GYB67_07815, partial [Chloroflexi bacterium]|nr:hypothetical protein [Chloroflexota bacterium]
INYWFFKRPSDAEIGQSWYYFRMAEPDFTPLPIYDAMREHTRSATPTLYPGVHQADHWAITAVDPQPLTDSDAQLGDALGLSAATFTAHGTDLWLRWAGDGPLAVTIGDQAATYTAESAGWHTAIIHRSTLPQTISVRIESAESAAPFRLDSVTVADRAGQNVFPLAAALILGGVFVEVTLILALIARRRQR